jgi:molybdopterin/thiamine biosynthesis adenylyltransferase
MLNPAFKKTLHPIIRKESSIEVIHNGQMIELDDLDGNLSKLLHLLDGTSSMEEIAKELNISVQELGDVIEALDDLGIVEDIVIPTTYSSTQIERYQSNFNYFSSYASMNNSKYSMQEKLNQSKVAVLGLGGGSLTVSFLAGLGIGEIVGVDYDTIERSNLNRQFLYNEDDIGRLKSTVADEKTRKINSDIKVKMYNREIKKYEDLLDIIEGCHAVISMMDQPNIIVDRWVNAACFTLGIPFYLGGFNAHKIRWDRTIPTCNEPCLDCKFIELIQMEPDSIIRLKTNYGRTFTGVNTGFAPNLAILTGLFTSDVTKLITGISPLMKPIISIDTTTMEISQDNIKTTKKPYCPTCSSDFKEMASLEELISIAIDHNEGVLT